MLYELDAEVIKVPDDYKQQRLIQERAHTIGWAARGLVDVYPELRGIFDFEDVAWRQIIYQLADPQGVNGPSPYNAPFEKIARDLFVEYNLPYTATRRYSYEDAKKWGVDQWNNLQQQVLMDQRKIVGLYEDGDVYVQQYIEELAYYTGQEHGKLAYTDAGQRPMFRNEVWLPRPAIRSPFGLIRKGKQVYAPVSPNMYERKPALEAVKSQTGVHAVVRNRNERLAFIGGGLTTVPMMEYFEANGIDAHLIPASEIDFLVAEGARDGMHAGVNTNLPASAARSEGMLEGATSVLIANTSGPDNFLIEKAIYEAAKIMEPNGELPAQIIIQENKPPKHREGGTYYNRCVNALLAMGFHIHQPSVFYVNGTFTLIAERVDDSKWKGLSKQYEGLPMIVPRVMTDQLLEQAMPSGNKQKSRRKEKVHAHR